MPCLGFAEVEVCNNTGNFGYKNCENVFFNFALSVPSNFWISLKKHQSSTFPTTIVNISNNFKRLDLAVHFYFHTVLLPQRAISEVPIYWKFVCNSETFLFKHVINYKNTNVNSLKQFTEIMYFKYTICRCKQ